MRLLVASAALLLCGSGAQEPVDLSFHPVRGTVLTKTFEVETEGWLDAVTWDGNSLMDLLGVNGITVEAELRVRDECEEVGSGRPLELLRDYESLRTVWDWRDRTEVLHPLLYRTVRFTWDPDHETYDKDWVPRRGSVRPLEGVWEDLDFRTLLPDEPVRVGDTWEVPLRGLAPVLLPGGAIHRDRSLWDAWDLFALEDTLSTRSRHWRTNGAADCRLEEVLSLGGRRIARVSLEWSWWGLLDLLDDDDEDSFWRRYRAEEALVEVEVEARGELLWDVEAGRFHAFELEAECEAGLDVRVYGGLLEVRASGQGRWTAEASPEEN